jgi:RNA polymerase sigma-70 factor (ECF subfamily)
MSDSEVISRVIKGEKDLFRILVERYQIMVFRTCIGFVHHKAEADDLTQEIFIKAFTSLSSFKGNSAFSTWLYRIAINACLNNTRTIKMVSPSPLQYNGNEMHKQQEVPVADCDLPDNMLIRKEQQAMLAQALDNLNEKQHTVFVLSKYDELSQREIALVMHTTEGAVESLLQRAKANLRQKLLKFYKNRKNAQGID